jgi:hypothetical protein
MSDVQRDDLANMVTIPQKLLRRVSFENTSVDSDNRAQYDVRSFLSHVTHKPKPEIRSDAAKKRPGI